MKTTIKTEVVLESKLEDYLNFVGADNVIQIIYKGCDLYLVIFKSYDLDFS